MAFVHVRSLSIPALASVIGLSAGCFYDFDEAFSESPGVGGSGAGTSTGGQGTGAAGGTGTGGSSTGGSSTGGSSSGGVGTGGTGGQGIGGGGGFPAGCECVPPPPSQWEGPVVRYFGAAFDVLPSCPAPWGTEQAIGFGDIQGAAHTCSACTCGAPNVTCGVPTTSCYNQTGCNNLAGTASPPGNGNCENTGFTMAADGLPNSARGNAVPVIGSCPESGGVLTAPPADWETPGIMCSGGVTVEGCVNPGEVCAYVPPAPFEKKFCIHRNGNRTCPADYPDKQLIDDGWSDTRSCSACNCASPSGVTCTGQTTLYSATNCGGSTDVINNNGSCQSLSFNALSSRYTATGGPTGGSCAASGGTPIGSASGGGQETLCCRDGM